MGAQTQQGRTAATDNGVPQPPAKTLDPNRSLAALMSGTSSRVIHFHLAYRIETFSGELMRLGKLKGAYRINSSCQVDPLRRLMIGY